MKYYCKMKMTSKGQVTVPLSLRNRFNLQPGTDVEFVPEGGKLFIRARLADSDPVEDWLKDSVGVARGKTSTDQIMKLTRGEK